MSKAVLLKAVGLAAVLIAATSGAQAQNKTASSEQKPPQGVPPAPSDGLSGNSALDAPGGAVPAPSEVGEDPASAPANLPDSIRTRLTYSAALAEVWRNNPEVGQAQFVLRAAGYEVSGSRTGYLPYIAVQQEQSEKGDSPGQIRIVQPLWNGGLTGAQVDQAKADQLAAMARLNSVRLDLGTRTNDAYFNFLTAQEMEVQWENYIAELQRLLKIIERRSSEGVAPQADVETARTRLSQARASAEANRASLEAARAQLATLLNFLPENVTWPDDRYLLNDEEVNNAGRVGIDAHPARQLALAEVQRQEALSRASKAQLWPQVNAEYRRSLEKFSSESGSDDSALLVLQYQTDSGLRAYQQYRANGERTDAARASYEAANRTIDAQIRTARAQRAVARVQLDVQGDAVRSSRALVESFLRQFDVGRKTWIEVLNALREYNDTVLQAVSVKRSYWDANGRLGLQGLYWGRLSDGAPTIDVVAGSVEKK